MSTVLRDQAKCDLYFADRGEVSLLSDDPPGDLVELGVHLLQGSAHDIECLSPGDPIPLHQDSLSEKGRPVRAAFDLTLSG